MLWCRNNDVFLSYLPLAHIFDRVAEETFLCIGGRIGYWQGDVKKLMDDIDSLKPTIFVGVPRIFDRIYTGVSEKVRSADTLQRFLSESWDTTCIHFQCLRIVTAVILLLPVSCVICAVFCLMAWDLGSATDGCSQAAFCNSSLDIAQTMKLNTYIVCWIN